MQELPPKYKKLVNQYKPIEVDGFTLYPFTVEHYEEYLVASRAIGYMQQELPIELMSIPLLSAFFKMDVEKVMQREPATGLFTSAVVALILALRLANDDENVLDAFKKIVPITDANDPTKLKHLAFEDAETKELRTITPVQFIKFRTIIAAQNGIEIPDELENPELVQAERDLAEKRAPKLKVTESDLIGAAAALTGADEEEIYGWAVLKLTRRLASFRRIIDYMMCSIAEGSGTTFKHGNPVPHPFFERLKEGSDALISMESFAGGQGIKAMQDAGVV